MAANTFEASKVSFMTASEGHGGEVRVSTAEDTLVQVRGGAWWNNPNLKGGDLVAQKQVKDFIEKQGPGDAIANRRVPVNILCSDGQERFVLSLNANREIQITRTADWLVD